MGFINFKKNKQKKGKEKKKDKICIRCKFVIKEDDNYLHIEEFRRGKKIIENYIHKNCWDEQMRPRGLLLNMMGRANKLLDKAEELS